MAYGGTKREGKKKVGNFMQIVSSYGVEIKKEYTAPLHAGYFSAGSFLFDSGVCRDLKGKLKLACDWL